MTPTPSNCRTSCSTKGELKGLVDGRLSDGQTLAMAIHDGAVKRLERRRVTCHRHDQSAFRPSGGCRFATMETYFATAGRDGTARVWDMKQIAR